MTETVPMLHSFLLAIPSGNSRLLFKIDLDNFGETILEIAKDMLGYQRQFYKNKDDKRFPEFKGALPNISLESLLGMLRVISTLELDHRIVLLHYSNTIEDEIVRRALYYDFTGVAILPLG